MLSRVRKTWRRLFRKQTVKTTVKLRSPITWDRFDRACYALNLNPETVRRKGREAWKDVEPPTLEQMQEFVDLVVKHPGRYDLSRDFEVGAAREFVGALAGFFLVESQMNSSALERLGKSSSSTPAFQFQMGKAPG